MPERMTEADFAEFNAVTGLSVQAIVDVLNEHGRHTSPLRTVINLERSLDRLQAFAVWLGRMDALHGLTSESLGTFTARAALCELVWRAVPVTSAITASCVSAESASAICAASRSLRFKLATMAPSAWLAKICTCTARFWPKRQQRRTAW